MWSDAAPLAQLMRVAPKKAKIAAVPTGKAVAVLGGLMLVTLTLGCSSSGNQLAGTGGRGGQTGGTGGQGSGGNAQTTTETITLVQKGNPQIDILFVLDNGSSGTQMQQKLSNQLPSFLDVLEGLPTPLDLHVAITTTDLGAPSDVMDKIGCTAQGDNGGFRSAPSGTCSTTLMNGATFLADDGNGVTNFTDPIASVLQCISLVGDSGCGFHQPLAAAARALGADNVVNGVATPPATNDGFLRSDASLAIIFLTNQDDCSAPAGTELFSLNGGQDNLSNSLGPMQLYRCNQYGHLCKDPASSNPQALIMPPLKPPSDAQGTTSEPTLDLTDCQDNDTATGLLTPVTNFVADIKALKKNPDSQIMVAAIVAPATPYTVNWVPAAGGQNTQPGELWPEIEHSCGQKGGDDVNPELTVTTTDTSFGDPGVRLAGFANGFADSLVASTCDASYAAAARAIATKIGQLPSNGGCLTGTIELTADGQPNCTAVALVPDPSGATKSVPYANCVESDNTAPCWTSAAGAANCVGVTFAVTEAPSAPSSSVLISCEVCQPGASVPGCP